MAARPATHLKRVSLADQVRDYLVLEIAQGRLSPGTPVRELEIAQQLGTSQTPVREAFRELTAVGLLESQIHVGTRVRNILEEDLVDGVPVRSALEGIAGRLAAERLDGDTASIENDFDAMLEIAATGDRLAYASASTRFHRGIVVAAQNQALLRSWNALSIEVMTILSLASNDLSLTDAAESHREILEALRAADPDRAEAALTSHVARYLPATAHD
ncbi:GntR family transcriptional regulator [soil metagenome]